MTETTAEPELLPRDRLLRDSFTAAEWMLYVVVLVAAVTASWVAGPRSYWTLGTLLIATCVAPVILKTHEHYHPFFVGRLWRRFLLVALPAAVVLLMFVVGLLNTPFEALEVDGEVVDGFRETSALLPVTTRPARTWIVALGYCAGFVLATTLFLVPKSQAFFERLLPWLVVQATLLCLVGLAVIAAPAGVSQDRFATFPYDGHWSAYAMIWSGVAFAYGVLSVRRIGDRSLLDSAAPMYFAAGILLGASAVYVDDDWYAGVQFALLAVLLATAAGVLGRLARDVAHRRTATLVAAAAAAGAFALAVARFRALLSEPLLEAGPRSTAAVILAQRPLFGWGPDAFEYLHPIFADDHLAGARYTRAGSDLLQMLAEHGVIGFLPFVLLVGVMVTRFLRGRVRAEFTWQLLVSLAAVVVLAAAGTPFLSPAVSFSFWLVFFSALRWGDLSRFRVDEVDRRPNLVAPEAVRRVPFYTGQQKERYK